VIVIVNGAGGAGQMDVAAALAERFDGAGAGAGAGAAVVPPDPARLATLSLSGDGASDLVFVVPSVFSRWRSLRTFRRVLASLDSTSYAFRLVRDERKLDADARVIQRLQEREALQGDVGLPVPDLEVSEAAAFIWNDIHEPVSLSPWNDAWTTSFEGEREAILDALGERALLVEHVGSTAVVGLAAKPIIDMLLGVRELESTDDYLPELRQLGYHFLDYPTNVDRYFFKKGRPRTHHLHVGQLGSAWMNDQIRFRDLLRTRPELRERYLTLKRNLEGEFSTDRARYSESKGAFVRRVLSQD
jgi:GrpB-like predicted nucleotidyltransferase (UPF0157 family)